MTYDPNQPSRPVSPTPVTEPERSGGFGWMIAAVIAALVIVGAFFVWPTNDRVATTNPPLTSSANEPTSTGTTTTTPSTTPAAPMAPSAPAAPMAPTPAPAAPTPAPAPSGAQ